jgi:hypothetical protein
MNLTRAHWLRSLFTGLAIVVAPAGASTLWAQGYGPDPFRPYNRQYDPYTYPLGPATPEAGQSGAAASRSGVRGANQFQNYMEELQGATRQGTEKYGIGMPYYRSSVDSSYDPNGTREYRPNHKADRSYDQTQDLVTRKYLAYFTERDPKKRAALLKDYNQTHGKISRALSTRRENPSRVLDSAAGLDDPAGGPAVAADSAPRNSTTTDRAARTNAAEPARRAGSSNIPPPPPLFGTGSSRGTRTPRTPDDVLNRSRRLNADDGASAGTGTPGGGRSTSNGRQTTGSPSSD